MEQEKLIRILKKVSFLECFTETELISFTDECNTISLEGDKILFEENSAGNTMYIVLSGTLEIFRKHQKIAIRKQGDFFGEMALIESKARSASVKAISDSTLLEISTETYDKYLETRPNVILNILKTLSARSRTDLDILDGIFDKLKRSEERYRNIVETISDIVFQIDPDGKIKYANSAVTNLGYDPKEIVGTSINDLIFVKDKSLLPTPNVVTKRVGSRATKNLELFFKTGDNLDTSKEKSEVAVLVDAFGLWNVENKIVMKRGSKKEFIGTLFIARDITERKRVEDKVIEQRNTLQNAIDEKTIELVTAKEKAERANKSKSEFLSRMSHELRTPLAAMLGFTQLLHINTTNPLTHEQSNKTKKILEAGDHLLNLINEVLDLSSIESDKLNLSFENINITSMIDSLINLLKPTAQKKNVELISNVKVNEEHITYIDRTRLKQILLNIISNAIKYNRENGSVTVNCKKVENGSVSITIEDTGIGIPSENIESIFEPFKRLSSDNTDIEGTGIGLSIVKRLTALMNGTVDVKSKVGQGSCFVLEFPGAKIDNRGDSTENGNKSETDKSVKVKRYTVLCVEDNQFNLEIIMEILKLRPEFDFIPATTGRDGIKMATTHLPDLVILDINLPDINGRDVFRNLQSNEETSKIPVIALSADAMEDDIRKTLDLGFNAYLTKPINIQQFFNTVDEVLEITSI